MCNEYNDDKNDKIIKLPDDIAQELWFDLQWPEDKAKFLEQEKQLAGLVKWVGL